MEAVLTFRFIGAAQYVVGLAQGSGGIVAPCD